MRIPIMTPNYKPQISGAIIISNTIQMMNNFCWFQISAKYLFHNKTMFKDLISWSFIRMIRAINKNISITSCLSTTFPIPMFRPSVLRHIPFSLIPSRFAYIDFMAFLKTLFSFWHNLIITRLPILRQESYLVSR